MKPYLMSKTASSRPGAVLRFAIGLALVVWAGLARADFNGVVVGVIDGDTVDVLVNERSVRVRLAEIDAPERSQPYGAKAKQALSSATFRQQVAVVSKGTDRYGRAVGTLFVRGTNVNRVLVSQGFAWAYRKYLRDPEISLAETTARENRVGVWSLPNPIPPWEWRRSRGKPQSFEALATLPFAPD